MSVADQSVLASLYGAEPGALWLQDGLSLRELPDMSLVQILALPGKGAEVVKQLGKLGIACPDAPNLWQANGQWRAAWHGPNQWMLIGDERGLAPALSELQGALEGMGAAVDQSHGRVGLRLSGSDAISVMQSVCALDMVGELAPGRSALTSVCAISALLLQVDQAPTYDLFVSRSFARYFAESLISSCRIL